MQVGLRVPSFGHLTYGEAGQLRHYARDVEEAGFDSLWVIEHLLVAPPVYATSWLDPLQVLAHVAATTERIKLGTGIVVLPLREPVILAKEVATLVTLSGGRLIFGVGVGWFANEFAAVGVPMRERGRRTDEILDCLKILWAHESATHRGSFFNFDGVFLLPRLEQPPPIWVAGGSAVDADTGKRSMPKGVLRRIVAADGWLSSSSRRSLDGVREDWTTIQETAAAKGRDPSTITFGHTQFLHIVEESDRRKAIECQERAFRRVMWREWTSDGLASSYLMGTIDDIKERLNEIADAGVDHLVLTPVSPDPRQITLIAQVLLPHLRGSASNDSIAPS